jgi:hypothetical protein
MNSKVDRLFVKHEMSFLGEMVITLYVGGLVTCRNRQISNSTRN